MSDKTCIFAKKTDMSISDKVRKDLWAKSGNRCAICRKELFSCIDKADFNIGEECHIVSSQPNGPRHIDNYGDYDSYENIILLCRNHHKEIDDSANLNIYSVEKLIDIKKQHEKWVNRSLADEKNVVLSLIRNGTDLVSIIGNGAVGLYKYNDEIKTMEEAELIGGVWQEISDYMDLSLDLEPIEITKMEFVFSEMINNLKESGFLIYGRKVKTQFLKKYGDTSLYNAAQVYIKRR